MKVTSTFFCLLALVLSVQATDLKVATVDLQKVLKGYYRAQEVAKQIEIKEVSFAKEMGDLRLEGQRLIKEAEELQAQANDAALSLAGRDERKKKYEAKLGDFRSFELRYETTRAQREAALRNQSAQATKKVIDEIVSTTGSIGEKEGFNLVLKIDRANPVAAEVLFAKGVDDLTDKVLAALNATRPPLQTEKKEGDRP